MTTVYSKAYQSIRNVAGKGFISNFDKYVFLSMQSTRLKKILIVYNRKKNAFYVEPEIFL